MKICLGLRFMVDWGWFYIMYHEYEKCIFKYVT